MRHKYLMLLLFLFLLLSPIIQAIGISELEEISFSEQLQEFFSFSSQTVINTVLGCVMLGILGGLLGSFLILRRMALMGDALGHSVLPGICIAFLITGTKSFLPLFIGAAIAGLISTLLINVISKQRRTKPDSVLGLVFTSFFGLGIVLLSFIQSSESGSQSGLDKFLFGQAAALAVNDLYIIATLLCISIFIISIFYKHFQTISFDEIFSRSIGLPVNIMHYLLMFLITMAVIVSVQAVGVILVSALLIIPAATAYLLVQRLKAMLIVSGLIGLLSGFIGSFFSYVFSNMSTGPIIVLTAGSIFGLVFLFSPREGVIPKIIRRKRTRKKIEVENFLKGVVEYAEAENKSASDPFQLKGLSEYIKYDYDILHKLSKKLISKGLLKTAAESSLQLSKTGENEGRRVLRNHLLWELYLNEYTDIAQDHVHFDAERIEHILTPDLVSKLEEHLKNLSVIPHSSPGVH